jgi:hypothetical protein
VPQKKPRQGLFCFLPWPGRQAAHKSLKFKIATISQAGGHDGADFIAQSSKKPE